MQKARGQAGPKAHRPPTARRHGVSGSVSSPGRGSSHRSVALLGSLSVVIEYLALRDGPRRFRPGFTCPTLLGYRLGGRASSPTGLSPALVPLSRRLRLTRVASHATGPTTPAGDPARFRLVPVRSPLLRESRLLSFPPGTEMFQFPGSARAFRDRRSFGSSPGLFAAFHARMLMTPRHPPRALRGLTTPIRPPRRRARGPDPQRPHAAGSVPDCRRRGVSRRVAGHWVNDPPRPRRLPRRGTRSVRVHIRGELCHYHVLLG